MPLGYKDCEHCGFAFPTKNSRAQYCSDAHRAAANRAKRQSAVLLFSDAPAEPTPPPQTGPLPEPLGVVSSTQPEASEVAAETDEDDEGPAEEPPAPHAPTNHDGALEALTHQRLSAADRVETWEGRAALILASRIDNHQGESGSGLKALWTSYREAMAMALSSAGAGAGSAEPAEATVTAEPEAEQPEPAPVGPIDMLAALRAREESRRDGTAS